jgi:hypothetical protein
MREDANQLASIVSLSLPSRKGANAFRMDRCLPRCAGGLLSIAVERPLSFGLSGRFIAVAPQTSTRMCHSFRAAAFDEIASFGDDFLHNICQLAQAGLPINEFGG